jgi:hypothetical protein
MTEEPLAKTETEETGDDVIELLNVEIHKLEPAPPGYFAVTFEPEEGSEIPFAGEVRQVPVVAFVITENQFSDNTTEMAVRPYVMTNEGLIVDAANLEDLIGFLAPGQKPKRVITQLLREFCGRRETTKVDPKA